MQRHLTPPSVQRAALVGPERDAVGTVGPLLDHGESRGSLGLSAGLGRAAVHDQAIAVLHERVIQDNMREIVRGRTVIVIAHRLAAVRNCHRIIAMDRGRIVEEGTHAELLARPGGVYARLWALQSDNVSA